VSLCAGNLMLNQQPSAYADTCLSAVHRVGVTAAGKFGQAPQRMAPLHLHFRHHGRDVANKAKAAARDGPDLRALAGLRALACLGILAGHLAYWVAAANPDKRKVPSPDAVGEAVCA